MTAAITDGVSRPLGVALTVRPVRAAVFVPVPEGADWRACFRIALRNQVGVWGGRGNLVLPLPGDGQRCEEELLWRLLDVFDADAFFTAEITVGDLRDIAPEQYRRLRVEREAQLAGLEAATIAAELEDHEREPLTLPGIPDALGRLAVARFAPLHRDGRPIPPDTAVGWQGAHPLTTVDALRPLPPRVAVLTGSLTPTGHLQLAALHGELGAALREQLSERVDVELVDARRERLWDQLPYGTAAGRGPWSLSDVGLATYRRGPAIRGETVLVVGDGPWDFALFYALRRLHGPALWLPCESRDDGETMSQVATTLARMVRLAKAPVRVCQASDDDERDALVATLAARVPGMEIDVANWRDVLPVDPLRLLERDRIGRPQPALTVEGATTALTTPVPRSVETPLPTELNWMVDVEVEGWAAARHPALGAAVVRARNYDAGETRCGRDAVAYLAPNVFVTSSVALEAQTVTPRFVPLEILVQAQTALAPSGWQCEPSDKGIYASRSAELLGGFPGLARALRDARGAVLTSYLGLGRGPEGQEAQGRRFFTLPELERVAADAGAADAPAVVVGLEEAGALRRGLLLKCAFCRQATFYGLDDVGSAYTCQRCRTEQPLRSRSWMCGPEPPWRYGLAEVVFQFLAHNGDLPLLGALHLAEEQRKRRAPRGPERQVQLSFELDLTDADGERSELDILLADGSDLWVGEATRRDRFADSGGAEHARLQRLAEVARLLNARGVVVVSAKTFQPGTRRRIDAVFPGPWPQLVVTERGAVAAGRPV